MKRSNVIQFPKQPGAVRRAPPTRPDAPETITWRVHQFIRTFFRDDRVSKKYISFCLELEPCEVYWCLRDLETYRVVRIYKNGDVKLTGRDDRHHTVRWRNKKGMGRSNRILCKAGEA